jgi:hypothetical protein
MKSYKPAKHSETAIVAPLVLFFELVHIELSLLNPAPDTSCDLIKSYSARSKQSTFNLAHFLGSFGAYTYVEGTKKEHRLFVRNMKNIIKFVNT